jgi:hypothetical protein
LRTGTIELSDLTHETVEAPKSLPTRDCDEILGSPEQIDELVDYIIRTHKPEKRAFWRGEYNDNARTALFEGLTAKGHLSNIELVGHPDEIHDQIIQRLVNGLHVRGLHPHEYARRRAEIREEIVIWLAQKRIMSGQLPPDAEILTVSTFPDDMTDDEAEKSGYRVDNRKGMLRTTRPVAEILPDGRIRRVVEQLSYSNSSAAASLRRRGQRGNDVTLIGHPEIYSRTDLLDGVVDVMRNMDGRSMKYGAPTDETTVDYADVRAVSAWREAQVEKYIDELADYERALDAQNLSESERRRRYTLRVQEIVRTICIIHPSFTADALGTAVVKTYEKAHQQYESGDYGGAMTTVESTQSRERAVTICGSSTFAGDKQSGNSRSDSIASRLEREKMEQKNWKWDKGYCRVKDCPTGYTEIGPCKVCRTCQAHFDDGRDPARLYSQAKHDTLRAKPAAAANNANNAFNYTHAKAIWGDGAFSGVEQIIDRRNNRVLAAGREAAKLWNAKPGWFF